MIRDFLLLLDFAQKPFISKMGVALLIILHMLTDGSRVLKKRRHEDLAEDGTLKIARRRDAGIKRGHKEGSLPHFLKEQSSQRAGEQLEKPAEFDSHVQDAMQNGPDEPLNSDQQKLEKKAQKTGHKGSGKACGDDQARE